MSEYQTLKVTLVFSEPRAKDSNEESKGSNDAQFEDFDTLIKSISEKKHS